jgi:hypothetical protein
VIDLALETLPQGGTVADIVPSGVRAAIGCCESLAAGGLVAGAPSPPVHDRVDSLASGVRSLFGDLGRPYAMEVFVGGAAELRLGIDDQWTSRLEVGLRNAYVFDLGQAAVAWGHLGPEAAPLGCSPPCTGEPVEIEIDATASGSLEIAILYRASADSVLWLRYEPVAAGSLTWLRTEFSGDPPYPWGFGLRVDSNGDGALDEIVYPEGTSPSDARRVAELRFRIHPSRPNPFQPATAIRYELPEAGPVTIAVFDVRGRIVRTVFRGPQTAGLHESVWDGRSAEGDRVPSGTYLVRVVSAWGAACEKLTVVR